MLEIEGREVMGALAQLIVGLFDLTHLQWTPQ